MNKNLLIYRLTELGLSPLEVVEVLEELGEEWTEDDVYNVLKHVNREAAEEFRKGMRLSVWRSDLRKEGFNRKRIVDSLVRETNIPRSVAEKIAKEVEDRIRSSNFTFLTSSLIREMVLIKLLEYGKEDAYRRYARLGIPVYDLSTMEGNPRDEIVKRILTQYSIVYILPDTLRNALFEGYTDIGGIANPFVHYGLAYHSRVSQKERWLTGLFQYLGERNFVSEPSIYIPPFEGIEEMVEPLKRGYKAILWSDENIEGVIRSEDPVFSFGRVPERKVLDVVYIDIEKMRLNLGDAKMEHYMDDILNGLEEYQERRRKLVKGGNIYIKLNGDYPIYRFRVINDEELADSEKDSR